MVEAGNEETTSAGTWKSRLERVLGEDATTGDSPLAHLAEAPWQPSKEDGEAAWDLYTELRTRITTQPLHPRSGDEATALKSVFSLFDLVRKLTRDKGRKAWHFATLSTILLNRRLRPFTANWHGKLVAGAFKSDDDCRKFRSELVGVQESVREFMTVLAELAEDNHIRGTETGFEPRKDPVDDDWSLSAASCRTLIEGWEKIYTDESANIERRRKLVGSKCGERKGRSGLSLSGGGIRSATFSLGFVQSLVKHKVFRDIDYLSTVSGGGYTGAFISSCLAASSSEGESPPETAPSDESGAGDSESASTASPPPSLPVDTQLRDESVAGRAVRNGARFLRVDDLVGKAVAAAAIAYGIVINTAVLFAGLIAIASLVAAIAPEHVGAILEANSSILPGQVWGWIGVTVVSLPFLYLFLRCASPRAGFTSSVGKAAALTLVASLVLGAAELACAAFSHWQTDGRLLLVVGGIYGASLVVAGVLFLFRRRRGALGVVIALLGTVLPVAVALSFLVLANLLATDSSSSAEGVGAPDAATGGPTGDFTWQWILLGLVAIAAAVAAVLVMNWRHPSRWTRTVSVFVRGAGLTIGVAGFFYLALALFEKFLSADDAALRFHPALVAGGLALLAAILVAISAVPRASKSLEVWGAFVLVVAAPAAALAIAIHLGSVVPLTPTGLALVAGLSTLALFFSVDVNETALHFLYRARLAATFIVDANGQARRRELADLASGAAPYHLINSAVNLPASKNPDLRGRRADFFVYSRHHSGSPIVGYRPTAQWTNVNPALDLATAMATSGAAVSSLMGRFTIAALTPLTTLANLRLGYWLRNPGHEKVTGPSSPDARYLLCEARGQVHENLPFVYVSDGGHIENLGLYELLRRRCKLMIVVDGEADADRSCRAIVKALRHAKIDLGVSTEIDLSSIRRSRDEYSGAHFALGVVDYGTDLDGKKLPRGYILYVKASLTGDEDVQILDYHERHPEFPHQSTADQLFDEDQFEAYRALGEHIGDLLFDEGVAGTFNADASASRGVVDWLCELQKHLLPPGAIPVANTANENSSD